ncbi:hypothetical protein MMC13_004118 [Lambiella insularis]|nr:hypothetical protein [Lambiella insularis]
MALQRPDGMRAGVPGEEDPMELSIDFDRRFLGGDDIDIDLGLGGKSPYNQEDEFMLEDNTLLEEQSTYDGPLDGNDDEMVDEVSTPHATEPISQLFTEDVDDENADFDILIDDEELVDVEDTISLPETDLDQKSELADIQPSSLNRPSQEDCHELFSDLNDSVLQVQDESYENYPVDHDDSSLLMPEGETEADSHLEDLVSSHNQPIDQNDDAQEQSAIHDQRPSAELPLASTFDLSAGTQEEKETSYAIDASTNEGLEYNASNDEDGLELVEQEFGTTSDHAKEVASKEEGVTETQEITQPLGTDLLGGNTSIQQKSLDTTHDDPNDGINKHGSSRITGDLAQEKHDSNYPQNAFVQQEAVNLHPIVVVYQNNEIYLFPPHEHDDEHSQTYFLQDESIANASMKELLGACRTVLADSISDQEELEVIVTPLGLVICELQQNDGNHQPEPLQMTLTTKPSLPHRLQYLQNAIAEGLGLVDVALPEHIDDGERSEDPNQDHAEHFHMDEENSTSDSRAPFEGETIFAEPSDGTAGHSGVSDLLPERQDELESVKVQEFLLRVSQDNETDSRQLESAADDKPLEETTTENDAREHEKNSLRSENVAVIDHSKAAPGSPSASDDAGDIVYNEQEESHGSSATSSTLRGDASEGGREDGVVVGSNPTDSPSDEKACQSNDIVETADTRPDHPDGLYDFDIGFGNTEPHDNLGPDLTGASKATVKSSSVSPAPQRKSSRSVSDIDNDEINYDEDEEEHEINDEPEDQSYEDINRAGDLHEGISTQFGSPGESLKRPQSLKRGRADEDDALISTAESIDLKRQRST